MGAPKGSTFVRSMWRVTLALITLIASTLPAGAQPEAARSSARDALLAQIDSFGFDSAPAMGVGGFLTIRIFPIVLFRDGHALTDVQALASQDGIARHRVEHPKAWTTWRREGAQVQTLKVGGWTDLPFTNTYPKLPDDFRLHGLFRSLTGAGTLAIGGEQSVAAFAEYQFFNDGRVQRGGGAGSRGGADGASVITATSAPERRGRYRVDGLEIVMTWDSGEAERRILITDPSDATASIWLDGVGYARRNPRR